MKTLENIRRVPATTPLAELKSFVASQSPFIIEGLFSNQPVEKISHIEDLRDILRSESLTLTEEYYKTFLSTGYIFDIQQKCSTIDEYIELLKMRPKTTYVLTELGSPAALLELIEVPEICKYRYGLDGCEDSIVSEFFVAGAGSVAHLHFDWDHRHVLLHQVFGRKRVTLIHPRWSAELLPLLNMSQISLEEMVDDERNEFLKRIDAQDAILLRGDSVFIPALMWHHLDYLDTAMSLSLRFGRTRHGRLFHERFHPNTQLQNFAWVTSDQEELRGEARETYARLLMGYTHSGLRGFELYQEMQRLFDAAYARHCNPSTVTESTCDRLENQIRYGIEKGAFYKG